MYFRCIPAGGRSKQTKTSIEPNIPQEVVHDILSHLEATGIPEENGFSNDHET